MGPPRKRVREDSSDESDEEQLETIHSEDVTIAIFCTLVEETAAVQETFDEELVCSSGVTGKAKYVYSFGRIGDHNIVIAQPVDMGTVNTALCASTVSQQFTNVRFALMVGIGAGIPSNKVDIRLGDVAISVPRDDHPGVIQYDFGKYESDGRFVRKGTMDKPPPILISAIRSLEVDEFRNKTPIRKILGRLIRQQSTFARPETDDVLYDEAFPHTEQASDCGACQLASDVKVVDRSPRSTATRDQPYIHRGLILSGSGVIKNPEDRERLRRGFQDAICFEMEAAGIMNEIPCLVIRGICDYADTHKQDGWHNYAAATAAAYCKAVLLKVPVDEVAETTPMREMMSNETNIKNLIVNQSLYSVHTKIDVIKEGIGLESFRRWLSSPDPSTNFNRAREQHQDGTGEWLTEGEIYSLWKEDHNSFILLTGIPGCGKTVLSSSVVADLKQDPHISQSLVYFYFDFNDIEKQSFDKALRSLITQLYEKRQDLRERANAHYRTCHEGGHQPSVNSLRKLLGDMIHEAGEVWIVLDALDECSVRNGLLAWIQELRQDISLDVHLMVTGRREQDINTAIEKVSCGNEIINMQSDMVNRDINEYIITQTKKMEKWQTLPEVQQEIEGALLAKAEGMFRWVACQFDVLNKCLDRPSVLRQLNNLPRTLNETYTRILQGIDKEYLHYARRLLQFLLYSERPLELEEAIDALAVDTSASCGSRFNPINRLPFPEDILQCCSNLVILLSEEKRDGSGITTHIRFAHFSVQEYLLSNQLDSPQPPIAGCFDEITARTDIANVCLSYLEDVCYAFIDRFPMRNGLLDAGSCSSQVVGQYYLAQYAARYWAKHAKVVELLKNTTLPSVENFLSSQEAVTFTYILGQQPRPYVDIGKMDFLSINALFYVSCAGLAHSAALLLEQGADIDAHSGGDLGTALMGTARVGEESIAKLLLERGASIDARTASGSNTALEIASSAGHDSIVELLLKHDAQIGRALHVASRTGNQQTIRLLVDHGADVNMLHNQEGIAPLFSAMQVMNMQGMEVLLQLGADVNTTNELGQTPLMIASRMGAVKAAQLLLENNADPYLLDQEGKSAFNYAESGSKTQTLLRPAVMPSFAALMLYLEPRVGKGNPKPETTP
ncbi:hypothetical protein PG991_010451 [Apiospora marii]|uniref:NACHT domain-containing protein n=1 Tax=Apiospora marii TaxID=335849 RepID=A0ABR1RIJ1_9PEZI